MATGSTTGSLAHLAAVAVLADAVYASILSTPRLFGSWELALPGLVAVIVTLVYLAQGRRG